MTKFQTHIKRFGSAMNFYRGSSDSAHKLFAETPDQKTQRRINVFATQTANQYYHMLVTSHALRYVNEYDTTLHGNCKSNDWVSDNISLDGDGIVGRIYSGLSRYQNSSLVSR